MADLLDETCSILTMECNDTHLAGVANKFRQSGRPDSRFVLEVNLKSMCPRLSRSSILETQNCVQAKNKYKPGSNLLEYYGFYTNTDSYNEHFFPKYEFICVCISNFPIYE